MEMKTDFLVIGSGLSGLYFALNASKYGKCLVITKGGISESNTKYAQGGIAAVFDKKDSFESHIKDTLKAGAGLCNKKNVKIMVENAPHEIEKLVSYGIEFDKSNGKFELGMEGAHNSRRILHNKDATGAEIENKLVKAVKNNKNISVMENIILLRLAVENKICYGALFLDAASNSIFDVKSKCTVLATGGIGQVYKYTTNPEIATGDGITASFEAGAEIENMEFVQFHPTALNTDSGVKFLISEALRGEGAYVVNSAGERFIKQDLKELAPRDILAREIFNDMKKSQVFLDISHRDADFIRSRFPNIYKTCLEFNFDITQDKIPITPAAHFLCGGIKTDSYGRTTIKNLFAVGECACTGVHGANRLASNSLLECLVFSARAAEKAKSYSNNKIPFNNQNYKKFKIKKISMNEEKELIELQNKIKWIMWEKAGIIRSPNELKLALREIAELEKEIKKSYKNMIHKLIIKTKNMIIVSKLIVLASFKRKKSVGCFYLE